MNNLKPMVFLIPIIALILACIIFFYFLKRVADKRVFKRLVFTIANVAFLLNLIWEIVQMPLYKNGSYNLSEITFCTLASVADALMVVLIYLGIALIYKSPFWIEDIKWQQLLLVILIGGVGAVLAEMRHLSSGSWAYSPSMPIVPLANVGLSPLLQFMILPLLSYRLSNYFIKNKWNRKH